MLVWQRAIKRVHPVNCQTANRPHPTSDRIHEQERRLLGCSVYDCLERPPRLRISSMQNNSLHNPLDSIIANRPHFNFNAIVSHQNASHQNANATE
jgi:hypothetical protein